LTSYILLIKKKGCRYKKEYKRYGVGKESEISNTNNLKIK